MPKAETTDSDLGLAVSPMSRRVQTFASGCLALVLLGLSVAAMWSAFATSDAAHIAKRSGMLADAYSQARFWVGAEESLERKYRLEPGLEVRRLHTQALLELNIQMAFVAANGTSFDRALAAKVQHENTAYAQASDLLFTAADKGDVKAEIRIDHHDTDPVFGAMQATVYTQADRQGRTDSAASQRLLHIEAIARWMTSSAVGVGILLVLLFAQLRRRYSRQAGEQARHNAYQATHDALTGLPNRLHFATTLNRELARMKLTGGSLGVVLLDLDRFKEVNDTLGHHTGDRLLQQVGPRLSEVLQNGEMIARLGGDEFALLVTSGLSGEDSLAQQKTAVHRILHALEAPFVVDDVSLAVEASAGLASYPADGDNGEVLLQRADIAMYLAKTNHENLAVYDRTLDGYNPRKLGLLADLRQAVDRDELVLYYQPLVDIATSRVRGVEALVRWQHPVEGLLPPSEFLPLAESSGFIHELTRYVLTRATSDAKAWNRGDEPITVSVNISARCLLDAKLPATVAATLAAADLPAHLLKLEITESAIIADPVRAQDVINRLHDLGVMLSIDDFGTGYTSLAYLRDLPVQELKIDQSFVMRMLYEHKDEVIVRTAVELAQRLGLESVAEGIEEAEVLAALVRLGCTTAQGYHLSRPMPGPDFAGWVKAWNSSSDAEASPDTALSEALSARSPALR